MGAKVDGLMAQSDAISVENTIIAILQANLAVNAKFVKTSIDINELLFKRGRRMQIARVPCVMVDGGTWDFRGNPHAQGGSYDRVLVKIFGMTAYEDSDEHEEVTRNFAQACKEVLNASATITDVETSEIIAGWVSSMRCGEVGFQPPLQRGAPVKLFRVFYVTYIGEIYQNV